MHKVIVLQDSNAHYEAVECNPETLRQCLAALLNYNRGNTMMERLEVVQGEALLADQTSTPDQLEDYLNQFTGRSNGGLFDIVEISKAFPKEPWY
jgi:hypothetical protein